MTPEELKARCKQFSLRAMRLVRALPDDQASRTIAIFCASIKTSRQNNR